MGIAERVTVKMKVRFETFLSRAKNDGFTENQLSYKSTTYLDDCNFKVVDTDAVTWRIKKPSNGGLDCCSTNMLC